MSSEPDGAGAMVEGMLVAGAVLLAGAPGAIRDALVERLGGSGPADSPSGDPLRIVFIADEPGVATPFETVDDATLERALRRGPGALVDLVRAHARALGTRGGSIVVVAWDVATAGGIGQAADGAAGGALLGFARSLARELAPEVPVNTVIVGRPSFPERADAARGSGAPEPGDVAAAVLATLANPGMTGTTIRIDRGRAIA